MATVYLREAEEADEERRLVRTGRFVGELHGAEEIEEQLDEASFEEALAWGRERSDMVLLDAEDDRYTVGAMCLEGYPALPAELLERIRAGRRRALQDWWLDRSERDPPMRFEVVVRLVPDDFAEERRPAQKRLVEHIAQTMRNSGYLRVRSSSRALERGLRELERQAEAAGHPEHFTWFGRLEFEIFAEAGASEHRSLTGRLRRLIRQHILEQTGREPHEAGDEDLNDRWGLDIEVAPPGYKPPSLPV